MFIEGNVYVPEFCDVPIHAGAERTEHGIGWEARRVGHCDAAIQMQRVRCAARKVSADKSDTWTYTIVFAGTENNAMNMYGSAGDGEYR